MKKPRAWFLTNLAGLEGGLVYTTEQKRLIVGEINIIKSSHLGQNVNPQSLPIWLCIKWLQCNASLRHCVVCCSTVIIFEICSVTQHIIDH